LVDVGHNHLLGPFGGEAPAERATDAAGASCHDYDAIPNFHG
jgi:hypothetical protein